MDTNNFPVLCGGTLFTLLLEAAKQGLKERKKWGESLEFTEMDVFEALIQVAIPTYSRPADDENFKSIVSAYKSCNAKKSGRLPIRQQANITTFDSSVKNEFQTPLASMDILLEKYIDVAGKGMWLIKALLDLIRLDQSIKDVDVFFVFTNNVAIEKETLIATNEISLTALLLGIWHYVVVNRTDNSIGKRTYDKWCKPGESPNTREPFQSDIGTGITQPIKLIPLKDEASGIDCKDFECTSNEDEAGARQECNSKNADKVETLYDIFEDATDKYDIAAFVDSDFTAMPLRIDTIVAVDEFVDVMRQALRSFRRKQDSTYKYVIDFLAGIEQYTFYMGTKMYPHGDQVYFHWLHNIDCTEVHEVTLAYRKELDRLYGLISGGGTISVYGYVNSESSKTGTDKDERDVLPPINNTQTVNNPYVGNQYGNNNKQIIGNVGTLIINND